MKSSKWQYLSYILSDELSAYRNGRRVSSRCVQSISNGDVCNHSEIEVSLHFGTHIDFPSHFISNAANADSYDADYFVTNNVTLLFLEKLEDPYLVKLSDIIPLLKEVDACVECLIIKTGMSDIRMTESYWSDSVGIDEGVATYLRNHYPMLRFIGFDFISVSGSRYRMLGRIVHREMLSNNILPIEDMDLSRVSPNVRITELIISPLRIKGAEAAPVTVLAKINDYD